MKYISYLKIRETNEQRGEIKIKLYQKNTLIIKLEFVMNPSLIFIIGLLERPYDIVFKELSWILKNGASMIVLCQY